MNKKLLVQGIIDGVFFTIMTFVMVTLLMSKMPVFGMRSYVVITGSMEPTIPVGSVVYVKHVYDKTLVSPVSASYTPLYKLGAVISFIRRNETVTHRIIGIKNNDQGVSYITRGDANDVTDIDPVPERDVIGAEVRHMAGLGKLILYFKTLQGFVLFIILPGLLYICMEIINIIKDLQREMEKKYKNYAV